MEAEKQHISSLANTTLANILHEANAMWQVVARLPWVAAVLTCDNKGPGEVAMIWAALPNQEILNLKGTHSQAGAEVAVPKREISVAI